MRNVGNGGWIALLAILSLVVSSCISFDWPVDDTDRPSSTQTPRPVDGQAAMVTEIVDGDTIEVVLDGRSYRLRYIGMDTPERDKPFFQEATAANRQLVEGQTVMRFRSEPRMQRSTPGGEKTKTAETPLCSAVLFLALWDCSSSP